MSARCFGKRPCNYSGHARVTPVKTGVQRYLLWIPAFAGMTSWRNTVNQL